MIEMPEGVDFDIKVTHHCKLFNMNEDPAGLDYFSTVNSKEDVSIDIKRQEVTMSKNGIVMVTVFYDRYEKIKKSKPTKKNPVAMEL